MIINGKAECNWTRREKKFCDNRTRTVKYQGKQVYLNSVSYLFGAPHGETIEVPAGVHTYNFEIMLPALLPYSVEGQKGFIRYKAEVTLDIPWGLDFESKRPIRIVRYDDLNLVESPNYRQPLEYKELKTFSCCCWASKPVYITMRLDKTGFGLGDRIPIKVKIVNNSSSNVCSTRFNLIRTEQFTSFAPAGTKHFSSTVVSKVGKGARAGETADFVEFLEIPPNLTTSNSFYCDVFKITYHVNCKVITGCFTTPPSDMNIVIAIGNVGVSDVAAFPQTQPLFPVQAPPPQDDLRKLRSIKMKCNYKIHFSTFVRRSDKPSASIPQSYASNRGSGSRADGQL